MQELVLAQHAVVDEDTGEAVADGALHQYRGHGGIDSSGKGADGAAIAYLFADGGDGRLDEMRRGPVGFGVADVEEEVAQQVGSAGSVADLGMKLYGPDVARGSAMPATALAVRAVREKPGGRSRASSPCDIQTSSDGGRPANKGFSVWPETIETWAGPYSRLSRGAYFSAQVMGEKLQAITDAEDG